MNEDNFLNNYNYIDWKQFLWLNNNSLFLQLLSVNTIFSPVLTILLPIILAFIPFFILKIRKIKIDLKNYLKFLKVLFKKHPLGKILNLSENTVEQNCYAVIGCGLFLFSIYQNIHSNRPE